MPPTVIYRGRIYGAVPSERLGEKYYLVVSNNRRNAWLDSVLTIRLTTSPKPDLDSIVVLSHTDGPWSGRALADDIVEIYRDEITPGTRRATPATMRRVDNALRAALDL